MAELKDINTPNWTLSLAKPGEVVTDLEAIDQNIRIILNSQRGSNVMEPEFGVDQMSHLDKPVNRVIPAFVKDITEQIARFEPRALVKSVIGFIDPVKGGFEVTVEVTWEYFNSKFTTKNSFKKIG